MRRNLQVWWGADIQIQMVGQSQRALLVEMYDGFEPLAASFGLPPPNPSRRQEWIGVALGHKLNFAAFSPDGKVVGHCFLVPDTPTSAELGVFVLQSFRCRGVGTSLVNAALMWGGIAGLRRVWSLTSPDNLVALRLQLKCGFRITNPAASEIALEIDLLSPSATGRNGSARPAKHCLYSV